MTKTFARPSCSSTIYLRGEEITNWPINMATVRSIRIDQYKWYPDNVGKPAIEFVDAKTRKSDYWVYDFESERDLDYRWLLDVFCLKLGETR